MPGFPSSFLSLVLLAPPTAALGVAPPAEVPDYARALQGGDYSRAMALAAAQPKEHGADESAMEKPEPR